MHRDCRRDRSGRDWLPFALLSVNDLRDFCKGSIWWQPSQFWRRIRILRNFYQECSFLCPAAAGRGRIEITRDREPIGIKWRGYWVEDYARVPFYEFCFLSKRHLHSLSGMNNFTSAIPGGMRKPAQFVAEPQTQFVIFYPN